MTWPKLTDEQTAALKKEHGDGLTVSEIRLPRKAGGGTVVIVSREPTYDDWDTCGAVERENDDDPIVARKAWADALIVWPTDPAVIQRFVELPFAFNNQWMAEQVMPFFGSGATISTRAL